MDRCQNCKKWEYCLFNSLSSKDLDDLEKVKKKQSFKKGDTFLKTNKNSVICIKSGISKLIKNNANGNYIILKLIGERDILGIRELFSANFADYEVMALEEMNVCFIPKLFIEKMLHNQLFRRAILKSLSEDLNLINKRILEMATMPGKQRLLQMLIDLEDNFGINEDETLKIDLSRKDLAALTGMAYENCLRCLYDLQQEGKIELGDKKIYIKNLK